jgi:hypothetical protein
MHFVKCCWICHPCPCISKLINWSDTVIVLYDIFVHQTSHSSTTIFNMIALKVEVKIHLSLCWIKHNIIETCGGVEVSLYLHAFFDSFAGWRWVISFTHWPLYTSGNNPHYQLNRRLGGTHSCFGCCGEKKSLCPCQELNSEFVA